MKIRFEKLCSAVKTNYKFSVFVFFVWAILGTAFSIDKSIDLYKLHVEIKNLELDVKYLSDELEQSRIHRASLEQANKLLQNPQKAIEKGENE